MSHIEESIEVAVPVTTAYNQWTQFEEFPEFMSGVERVDQLSDSRTHWVTNIAGTRREFDADITQQVPDERVAWASRNGPKQAGVVTFHRLNESRTKIMLQMEYAPENFTEAIGDKMGIVRRKAKQDLDNFKEFIESRGTETGTWRGKI
ncbi:SRPBCC family protein [Streptomyces sp. ST2-7A]|uniref:SRPBCC family protein n=1 Tax=Streptomyces sp. ST2-7A TaxID=2907214 RepID=UPI001F210DE6|nr:SRPBCC family protein [Streptomyces sp. ST2-7A]MCE7081600.1 SRPBCC family protein [Streptomyces sp. ST2-7A]